MRVTIGMAILTATALGGCTPDLSVGPTEYLDAQVRQMSADVFAVGIEARNADEYAYARCVAANYVKYQQVAEFGQVAGPPLNTRFFTTDQGLRVVYSYGVLQFTTATTGEDAPSEVLSVSETLAGCQQRGIPTKFRAAATG
jgi:hypothetical protein